MSERAPEEACQALRNRMMLVIGAIAPVALFLVAMIAWTVVNGLPGGGRGLVGGLLTLAGIAVIGGGYWLADRYWINPRG